MVLLLLMICLVLNRIRLVDSRVMMVEIVSVSVGIWKNIVVRLVSSVMIMLVNRKLFIYDRLCLVVVV